MTDQQDYRLYLEEKFNALHAKLDTIVDQVRNTNSRTYELSEEDERIEKKVDDAMVWAHHIVDTRVTDCPLLPRIEEIESDLSENTERLNKEVKCLEADLFEYRFFKKYPKLTIILVTIFVIGTIISVIGTVETIGNKYRGKEILQNQQNEQAQTRGYQQYNPFDKTKADSAEVKRASRLDSIAEKYLRE